MLFAVTLQAVEIESTKEAAWFDETESPPDYLIIPIVESFPQNQKADLPKIIINISDSAPKLFKYKQPDFFFAYGLLNSCKTECFYIHNKLNPSYKSLNIPMRRYAIAYGLRSVYEITDLKYIKNAAI